MTTTATAPQPTQPPTALQPSAQPLVAAVAPPPAKPKRVPRPLTLDAFRRKYSDREDGFKYEFSNGIIEKTTHPMKVNQYHIVANLLYRFSQTAAAARRDVLAVEIEQLTLPEQLRRPDLALLRREKMTANDESVSEFVIEIISPTDRYGAVGSKMREYFAAGVRAVWQIVPELETVYVFTSPTQITVCEGDTMCSAVPVLPDFEMTAREIFAK